MTRDRWRPYVALLIQVAGFPRNLRIYMVGERSPLNASRRFRYEPIDVVRRACCGDGVGCIDRPCGQFHLSRQPAGCRQGCQRQLRHAVDAVLRPDRRPRCCRAADVVCGHCQQGKLRDQRRLRTDGRADQPRLGRCQGEAGERRQFRRARQPLAGRGAGKCVSGIVGVGWQRRQSGRKLSRYGGHPISRFQGKRASRGRVQQ